MKREYVRPTMSAETFTTNDYIAACYKIFCKTPNGNASYNELYWDSNSNGTLDSSDKKINLGFISSFHGCDRYHNGVVQADPPSANGFVSKTNKKNPAPVFVWEEKLGASSDYHVMTPGGGGYVDITSTKHPNASA